MKSVNTYNLGTSGGKFLHVSVIVIPPPHVWLMFDKTQPKVLMALPLDLLT